MRRALNRSPLRLILSGLLLLVAACGPALSESEVALADEPLGTQESAVCAGLSVTSVTIDGFSIYEGVGAGSGRWTVSSGANAARVEYYLNNSLNYVEERMADPNTYPASGPWHFSYSPLSCGVTHTLLVKVYPMVVDSIGNRTTCISTSKSVSQSASEACPPPSGDSCMNKCGVSAGSCWCDTACVRYGDCCSDYSIYCGP
jgi:hypothetical protein